MFVSAVRFPETVMEATEAAPDTSNMVEGEEVPIPTLLLVESTFNVVVSTVRSSVMVREDRVELPDTVMVSVSTLVGLNVMGPMPDVLVEGRINVVGVILLREVKSLDNESIRCSRTARAMPEGLVMSSRMMTGPVIG